MKDSVVYSTITCLPVSWGTVSTPGKREDTYTSPSDLNLSVCLKPEVTYE